MLDVTPARLGKSLKDLGVSMVWGVEANPETAAVAAQHLDNVVVGMFEDHLVPDDFFDVVVFNDVLEHMSDPSIALKIAAKKLKRGGVVVASIPNLRQIDNLIHIFWDKDFQYERNGIRDNTHLRFYTLKSVTRLFEDSGYTVKTLEGINETWWQPSFWRRLAFRLFPRYLADTRHMQYAVVAEPISRA
jgi:2-polyprenyl-3-methyl-5-hydroxy-6-metoxy-1,4-benzoquinol methylase